MRHLIVFGLIVAGSFATFGQTKKADTSSVEQALMQMERDWSQVGTNKANVDKDAKTLETIMADDWTGFDFMGKQNTKAEAIANLRSGAATTQSVELAPMKVRVFGDTAIVTGGDTEKSTYKGKDSSGKYVWMDVFVNRNGKWQAVSSESTKVQ